ncbi:MAG TPA: 8-amino-7-oxononanoate synthase [Spirochaetia bacterium]|nr:MAG: hypothetical protein A2Y41_08435 [Spirochaetes bacterium GWB1_36_13]HCL57193.1 8-amino-7-oxononanoate synthase [Spirochaetia bacterium]
MYEDYQQKITSIRERGLFRSLKKVEKRRGSKIRVDGKEYLNLSSNDYLGIAVDEEFHKEFYQPMGDENRIDCFGLGSSSSRLLSGNSFLYDQLEKELALWYKKESALVFNSGYHANLGILPALTGKDDVVFSDKENHASLIDGLKLSEGEFFRFPHLDYDKLEEILKKKRNLYKKAVIVSESVFSMDGDRADLKRLAELKEKYDCMLYIDEAHAAGVLGETGQGQSEEDGVSGKIDILVGTFGKALAGVGAYAVMDEIVKDMLVNTMRPFIFTTALSPVQLYWSLTVVKKIPFMKEQRNHLKKISKLLRTGLAERGFQTGGDSQIIPVFIGENEKAVKKSEALQKEGLLLFPIRPPTVPAGTARIRISLGAFLSEQEMEWILSVFEKGGKE